MISAGDRFQATIPDASAAAASPAAAAASSSSAAASSASSASSVEGTAVWLCNRVKDPSKVDAYLRSIDELFYRSTEHFDEERALELLHRCNYDSAAALELAQPWAKTDGETDEIDAVNGGMKAEFDSDDMCSVCGDGGDLIICDAKGCKKVYHAVCAELSEVPSGTWECSVHFCANCGSGSKRDSRQLSCSCIAIKLTLTCTLPCSVFLCAANASTIPTLCDALAVRRHSVQRIFLRVSGIASSDACLPLQLFAAV